MGMLRDGEEHPGAGLCPFPCPKPPASAPPAAPSPGTVSVRTPTLRSIHLSAPGRLGARPEPPPLRQAAGRGGARVGVPPPIRARLLDGGRRARSRSRHACEEAACSREPARVFFVLPAPACPRRGRGATSPRVGVLPSAIAPVCISSPCHLQHPSQSCHLLSTCTDDPVPPPPLSVLSCVEWPAPTSPAGGRTGKHGAVPPASVTRSCSLPVSACGWIALFLGLFCSCTSCPGCLGVPPPPCIIKQQLDFNDLISMWIGCVHLGGGGGGDAAWLTGIGRGASAFARRPDLGFSCVHFGGKGGDAAWLAGIGRGASASAGRADLDLGLSSLQPRIKEVHRLLFLPHLPL